MNIAQYENITITDMDSAHTSREPGTALHNVHLRLSARPSPDWATDFTITWKEHIYGTKRKARMDGATVIITCALEELPEHKAELLKVMAEVDARQQAAAIQAQKVKEAVEKAARQDRQKIEQAANLFNNG